MKNGQTTPSAAVEKISMNLIDPFPNHPFYIFDDNEMIELIESIRKNGLITSIIVRRKGDRYELISGHRRMHAYEYLGYAEIACSVINASDDEAVIMMVDSNCQRTKILPSERAFAYKMKLEANMELVDVYADEGITGTSVAKRDDFNRMIKDCKLGKIDRIYIKSVSRFARNALDCLEYIRLLKECGVSVFFENDGIEYNGT